MCVGTHLAGDPKRVSTVDETRAGRDHLAAPPTAIRGLGVGHSAWCGSKGGKPGLRGPGSPAAGGGFAHRRPVDRYPSSTPGKHLRRMVNAVQAGRRRPSGSITHKPLVRGRDRFGVLRNGNSKFTTAVPTPHPTVEVRRRHSSPISGRYDARLGPQMRRRQRGARRLR